MRVLVVDDSGFSRGVLRGLFQKLAPGCTVQEAGNADAAMSAIDGDEGFDLITIDMHMPGKDGLELARDLRAAKVDGRLALVTANNQAAIRGRAEDLGLEFVAKPLSESKLASLVRS